MKLSILVMSAAALLYVLWPAAAEAQTWLTSPGSGDWNTAGNWNPATVPNTQTAVVDFGTSNTSAVSLSSGVAVGSITFNGTTAYTVDLNGQLMVVAGAGITNSSGLAQNITVNGTIDFKNSATAGGNDIAYSVQGAGSTAQFQNNSTLGAATFTVNSGATLQMIDTSTGGTARIINNGTLLMQKSDGVLSVGSLEGSGLVSFSTQNSGAAAQTLTAGTLNTSTIFSGQINDGTATGALTKAGTGTLTLTGTSGYSGATTVSAGTLALSGGGSIAGSSLVTVGAGSTATFDISGTTSGASIVGLAGDSNGIVTLGSKTLTLTNTSTANQFYGAINGTGGLTITGGGLALGGINGYTGATTINSSTFLQIIGTASIASSSKVINNGTLDLSVTTTGASIKSLAGTTANANLFLDGGKTLTITAANDSYAGNISGTGGSLVLSGGTQTLTGAISYTGGTTVNGGTLEIGSGGSITQSASLTNAAGFVVDGGGSATFGTVTNSATGTINVAAGGTVHDDLNNAGTVTNNGTYVANVAANTGTITNNSIWTGNVSSNTGTIANTASATWTGNVSSAGTLNNAGTITGTLANMAGTTTNAGIITGAGTISGGTFTGAGSIGGLSIGNGASFAPGNGTPGSSATVNGNLAFSSGAFYQVAINPQTASFTNATGSATLGGASVQAFFSAGSYVAKQYTIVSATGGVLGTFNALANTNLPSGFSSSLSYDGSHAFLDLALNFTPPGAPGSSGAPANNGLDTNQRNVGNAIVNFFNSNGSVPIVFGALTATGLTQVSGETATGSQQTTFSAMNLFMGVMTDPFVAGRGDGAGAGGGATGYADEANGDASTRKPNDALAAIYNKAPAAVAFEQRWSTWLAGYGGSQTTDGNAALGSNTATSSVYGTAVGADYRFSPDTLAGFSIAGGGTNFSGAGSGRSDLFQAGAFVRHNEGPAYLSAALAYGWQDITTDRFVTAAGSAHLRAEFNANAISGRLEGGTRFVTPFADGVGVTPYAAGQFTTFQLPAYAESVLSGAGAFALNYGAKSVTDTRSELGIRTDKSYAMANGILTLRGRAAWAHDYDPDRSVAATFQSLPGASFVVNGASQAADSALATASAEMKWINGWSIAATFEGEFSDVTRSYAGKGLVRYAW